MEPGITNTDAVGRTQVGGEVPAVPLILLPGMGADERMFQLQQSAFPQLVVPAWLPPGRRESLPAYAERMARAVDPGTPCVVGGASFGGFVAIEMARHLDARAVVLIGSACSPAEFGRALGCVQRLAPLARVVPFGLLRCVAGFVGRHGGPLLTPTLRLVLRHLGDADAGFLRWASEATLRWRRDGGRPAGVPVFQIHGGRDPVLPVRWSRAGEVIPRGGHVISLSHAKQVNAFLRRCLSLPVVDPLPLGSVGPPAYDQSPKENPTQWPSTPPDS